MKWGETFYEPLRMLRIRIPVGGLQELKNKNRCGRLSENAYATNRQKRFAENAHRIGMRNIKEIEPRMQLVEFIFIYNIVKVFTATFLYPAFSIPDTNSGSFSLLPIDYHEFLCVLYKSWVCP